MLCASSWWTSEHGFCFYRFIKTYVFDFYFPYSSWFSIFSVLVFFGLCADSIFVCVSVVLCVSGLILRNVVHFACWVYIGCFCSTICFNWDPRGSIKVTDAQASCTIPGRIVLIFDSSLSESMAKCATLGAEKFFGMWRFEIFRILSVASEGNTYYILHSMQCIVLLFPSKL
jgi:hypothetical protein